MNTLIKHIKTTLPVSESLEKALSEKFKPISPPKNTLILKEGQYCRKLYFLAQGTARTFYLQNGKDVTSWIYRDEQFFSSWFSFLRKEASFENIEVLEESVLYEISYDDLQSLYSEFPEFDRYGRLLIEDQFSFLDLYSKGYMFMTAKEKYNMLLSHFPDLPQRVNLGHIASLLGISQETLSRIRSQK